MSVRGGKVQRAWRKGLRRGEKNMFVKEKFPWDLICGSFSQQPGRQNHYEKSSKTRGGRLYLPPLERGGGT